VTQIHPANLRQGTGLVKTGNKSREAKARRDDVRRTQCEHY